MLESQSSVFKIMQKSATVERQILTFPQPYERRATSYPQNDFRKDVRNWCLSKPFVSELNTRISKAIVLGDLGVGKTSLIRRFCYDSFVSNYKTTIGVDFEVERFDILQIPFNLQIWDTAGQEKFKCIASAYYRSAHIIAVVFDVTSINSLYNCSKWLKEALDVNPRRPFVFLVGSKIDLMSHTVLKEVEKMAVKVAEKLEAEFWPVSSRRNQNVKDMFFRMAALAFDRSVYDDINLPTNVCTISTSVLSKSTGKREAKKTQRCNSC